MRIADGSGGGPAPGDAPITDGEAPIASLSFRRFLPPKRLRLMSQTVNAHDAEIVLERPRVDYPAAVFAGIPNAIARLRAIYDANALSGGVLSDVALPDADAVFAEIRVMVRAQHSTVMGRLMAGAGDLRPGALSMRTRQWR